MGVATEIVTVQHESAKAPRQVRISPRVRRAIDAMVFEGLKRSTAAEKAGLTDNALYIALRKPDVLAYLNAQQGVLRTSAAARTIAKAEKLMDEAQSEHVQTQNLQWLAGLQGISPIAKSETLNVHKHLMPGLTIQMGGWSPHEATAHLIDGQVHEVREPHVINRIGQPVLHPSMRNEQKIEDLPGEITAPVAGGEGQK